MRDISTAILPGLESGLTGTAQVLNEAARGFANFITSGGGAQQIESIMAGLNSTLAALLPGIGAFGQGILSLFEGSTGPATSLAESITRVGESFAQWAEGINQSGQLAAFVNQANSVLGVLLGIVGNVGSILGSVFGAGADEGFGLLSVFRDLTGQFAEFLQTAGAQAGLASFFDLISQTGQTISELGAVIGPVFGGLFAVIGQLLPQINALRDALLPVAIVLGEAIGTALTGLAPVVGLVAQLIVGLVQALAPLVTTLVTALGPAIAQIGDLFATNLAPAIAEFLPLIAPLAGLLLDLFGAQLVSAITAVVDILGGLFNVLGGLITFMTGVFTGDWETAWAGIQQIVAGVGQVIVGLVAALISNITNPFRTGLAQAGLTVEQFWGLLRIRFRQGVVDAINVVVGFVANVRNRFVALGTGIVIAARNLWSRARSAFQSGVLRVFTATSNGLNRVIRFVASIPGRIVGALGNLGSLLFNAGRNVMLGLINGISSLIGTIASTMSNVASTIRGYLPFSPARVGPLSGIGSPENSGEAIAQMIADGIQQNINLPARAMERALAPLAPSGLASTPFQSPTGAGARERADGVNVTQVFTGPTTSGGRLDEMTWNIRFATQARREVIGGVPTA
jgi:phage-related protein